MLLKESFVLDKLTVEWKYCCKRWFNYDINDLGTK